MFDSLVSPSVLVKREILAVAVQEAIRYRTTVKDVVDAFFSGVVKPEMAQMLDQAEHAAGIPPSELMNLIGGYLDPEEVEPQDLVILLSGHQNRMPTPAQVKEISETALRLLKRARNYEKRVRAAQAAHDANIVMAPEPPNLDARVARARQIRARVVQRHGVGR